LGNQIRGLLAEYGLIIHQGISAIRKSLPDILEDADNGLTSYARELFADLQEELRSLDERFEQCNQTIKASNKGNEVVEPKKIS